MILSYSRNPSKPCALFALKQLQSSFRDSHNPSHPKHILLIYILSRFAPSTSSQAKIKDARTIPLDFNNRLVRVLVGKWCRCVIAIQTPTIIRRPRYVVESPSDGHQCQAAPCFKRGSSKKTEWRLQDQKSCPYISACFMRCMWIGIRFRMRKSHSCS